MDLKSFRGMYPQYDDLDDQTLADGLYQKHYSDMSREEFDKAIGVVPAGATTTSTAGHVAGQVLTGALNVGSALDETIGDSFQTEKKLVQPTPTNEYESAEQAKLKRLTGGDALVATPFFTVRSPEVQEVPKTPEEQLAERRMVREKIIPQIPVKPELKDSFWATDVPRGVGGAAGFMAGAGIGEATGLGFVLPVATLGAILSAHASKEAQEAAGKPVSPEATALEAGVGAVTAVAPWGVLLNSLDKVSGGLIKKVAATGIKTGITMAIMNALQTTAGNAVAQRWYDKNRDLFAGVPRATAEGGVVGTIIGAGAQAARGVPKAPKKVTITESDFAPTEPEINDVAMERMRQAYKTPEAQSRMRQEQLNQEWAAYEAEQNPPGEPPPGAPKPAPVPTGGPEYSRPAPLPTPGVELPGQETAGRVPPLLTDHPVQLALQEVHPTLEIADSYARWFNEHFPKVGYNVQFYPVEVEGGYQLRLGTEPPYSATWEAFRDEQKPPELSDPQALATAKADAEMNRIESEGRYPYNTLSGEGEVQPQNLSEKFTQDQEAAREAAGTGRDSLIETAPGEFKTQGEVDLGMADQMRQELEARKAAKETPTLGPEGTYAKAVAKVQDVTDRVTRMLKMIGQSLDLGEGTPKEVQRIATEDIRGTKMFLGNVLAGAVDDVGRVDKPKLVQDAKRWLMSEDTGYGSFKYITEALDLPTDATREAILSGTASAESIRDAVRSFREGTEASEPGKRTIGTVGDIKFFAGFDPISMTKMAVDTITGKSRWSKESDILKEISDKYLGGRWFDTDMAYSKGNWHGERAPEVINRFDKYQLEPGTKQADTSKHIPMPDGSSKALAWDPPFLVQYGPKGIIGERFTSFKNMAERNSVFEGGMKEGARILADDGTMVVKMQSYFQSIPTKNNQVINNVAKIIHEGRKNGLELVDNYMMEPFTSKNLYAKKVGEYERLPVQYLVFKKADAISPTSLYSSIPADKIGDLLKSGWKQLFHYTNKDFSKFGLTSNHNQQIRSAITPEHLYSFGLDTLARGFKDLFGKDEMPGGGGTSRLGRVYWSTLGTPFWKKMQDNQFGAFYNVAAKKRDFVIAPTVEKMNRLRDPWRRMDADERDNARDILWSIEGRKLTETPSPEIESFDNNGVGNVRVVQKHLDEFRNWLEKTKGASQDVTDFLVARKQAMLEAFSDHYNHLAKRGDVDENVLQDLYNNVGMIPNYHPHMFYGRSYIEGTNAKGEVRARVPLPRSLDLTGRVIGRVPGLEKFKAGLQNDPLLKGLNWSEVKDASENERYWMNSPVPLDIMSRLLDESAAKIEADPNLAPTAKAFRNTLLKETLHFLKTRGFSNFAQRKGILGYERGDIMGTTFDYLQGVYSGLAKLDASREYTKLLFEAKPNAANHKLLTEFIQDDMSPSSKWQQTTDKVRMGLYLRYLGGRIKSAVVNLTNMPVASFPILYANAEGVNGLHASAAADVAKQFKAEVKLYRNSTGLRGLKQGNVLNPTELKFMTDYSDSVLQAQQMNEFKGERDNTGFLSKASDVLGKPMEMTEWYMRSVTGLAALRAVAEGKVVNERVLKENGWTKGQKVDLTNPLEYEKAADFASNIISQAYGDYTGYNKPQVVRKSPSLKTMYTFRFYNQHLAEMWNHYLRGNEGARGQVAAMASMTMQGVLGGMKSMPIAAALMAMYKMYSKEDFETTTREAFPDHQMALDAAFEGMPSLGGVTIGSSLDVGFPSNIKEAIGIPAAVVSDAVNTYQAWEAGNSWKAAEYMAPLVAVRDVLSAIRESTLGQRTVGGRPIAAPGEIEPATLTGYEALVKLLGFQPTSREKLGRARTAMAEMEALKKDNQGMLADRYTNAVVNGDFDKAAKILDEVIAWNILAVDKGTPELMISKESLSSALKTRTTPKQPSKPMLGRGLSLKDAYGLTNPE